MRKMLSINTCVKGWNPRPPAFPVRWPLSRPYPRVGPVLPGHLRFLRCHAATVNMPGMTLADLVKKNVERLPMREQARIFSESFRASAKAQEERFAAARETFASLSEAEGRAMEEALRWGRPVEPAE